MLTSLDLVAVLNKDEFKYVKYLEFRKSDVLYFEGDACNNIDILVKGEITMTKSDLDGNEETFNYMKAPNIFGNNLIFASSNHYLGNVTSYSDVALYRINKANLLYLLSNNKTFLSMYLELIADKSLELSKHLQVISIQNVEKRILSFLKMKFKENNGYYQIHSMTSFAKELSLPRETTSRMVYKLSRANKFVYMDKTFKEIKNALDSL